jgi:RNA 2',3'-cyclic 3'-phosphodiesterase
MTAQLCLPGIGAAPTATDRLFFALLPDPAVTRRISACARALRRECGLHCRLLDERRWHLTLQHMGDHFGFPAPRFRAALDAAAQVEQPEFTLRLDRALTFTGRGTTKGPRPCVLTVQGEVEVCALHRSLGLAMRACGLAADLGTFTPHITLFYDCAVVEERRVEPIAFRVREFFIVHSRIGSGQPYRLIGRWPLGVRSRTNA